MGSSSGALPPRLALAFLMGCAPGTGPNTPPEPSPTPAAGEVSWQKLTAGVDHACGLSSSREAACWGPGADGLAPPRTTDVVDICAGGGITCVVGEDEQLSCSATDSWMQEFIPSTGSFSGVDCGRSIVCATRTDGTAVCWATEWALEPWGEQVVEEVSAGTLHACARTVGGAVDCVGLWKGTQAFFPGPSAAVSRLSSFGWATCGLSEDDEIECWSEEGSAITLLSPDGSHRGVSAGAEHACAVELSGGVSCWGPEPNYVIPDFAASLSSADRLVGVDAGWANTCVWSEQGAATCWNMYGSDPADWRPPSSLDRL